MRARQWQLLLLCSCALIFLLVGLQFGIDRQTLSFIFSSSTRSRIPVEITPETNSSSTDNPSNDTKEEQAPRHQHHENHSNIHLSSSGLIIHVQSWAEGMAGWLTTLAKLQVLAKKLNATLVEPGILNGRLVRDGGHMPLFELMDQAKFDPDVSWMSLENFQQLPESSMVTTEMCLARCSGPQFKRGTCAPRFSSPGVCSMTNISSDYRKKSSPQLQEALDLVAEGKLVVLKIRSLWKDSFDKMQVMMPPAQEKNGTRRTLALYDHGQAYRLRAQFDFQPRLYEKADIALQLLGIQQGQPFHAIHWRAELAKMNYTECAMRILTAQEQMALALSSSKETKFVLLSSLSTNETRQWKGSPFIHVNEQRTALSMLLDRGTNPFVKVDQVYDEIELQDPIESAAIDLILAQRASQFATCTKTCSQNCLACNYAGTFAFLAIGMRTKQAKLSYTCWPNNKENKDATLPVPSRGSLL